MEILEITDGVLYPVGVCSDSDESVYVLDYTCSDYYILGKIDKNRVIPIAKIKTGKNEGELSPPIPGGIGSWGVDTAINFYIPDTCNHRILKLDPKGTFLWSFGKEGLGDGEFNLPRCVIPDRYGHFYIADTENNRILKFSEDQSLLLSIGICEDNDDDGHLDEGRRPGEFEEPTALAIDNQENIYVADTNNHRIEKFNEKGVLLKEFGEEGHEDGKFYFPTSLVVDGEKLWVADDWNQRVQIFDLYGKFIRSFVFSEKGSGGQIAVACGRLYIPDSKKQCVQCVSKGE